MTRDDVPNDIQHFVVGTADTAGKLRAERSGTSSGPDDKPGRVYALEYRGSDRAGNVATCGARVHVPHDAP